MHRNALISFVGVAAAAWMLLAPRPAAADPSLRTQMDVQGDFVLLGNTLVHDCASGTPEPEVGTIGDCPDDDLVAPAPDVFWRADEPTAGEATADSSYTSDDARTTSVLQLPDGAEVVYARIYWGGLRSSSNADEEILLERPEAGLMETISADDAVTLPQNNLSGTFYQSTADITELVQERGEGAYRVSGVSAELLNEQAFAAWYMVVFYELDGAPSRNLAIFDSLEYVAGLMDPKQVSLDGFIVPDSGYDAKLGVVAYEGEGQLSGESASFNGTALSNAENPQNNFFNASRTYLGSPVSIEGDLPQLSGSARGYSNVDLDVVDVTSEVSGGDTSASISARSDIDVYVLSAFITSISTLVPDFTRTTKEVVDLNGGVAAPGDTLEYRFVVSNQGSDTAVDVVLQDEIPDGVTFVPGSLSIEDGPNAGNLSDASGDDQGEHDQGTVTVRLGDGAGPSAGGSLAIGVSREVRFQVTIDENTRGEISNQGIVTAAGEQGAPETDTPTDANADEDGQNPTTVTVVECGDDSHCEDPTPYCDLSKSPPKCVGCANSGQCEDPRIPDCNPDTQMCECATGPGTCHDTDDDGISDGGEDDLGTDPNDADTDDDGVLDGDESSPDQDNDGDGSINALDPDSDDDGLPDGTELGEGCDHPDTDTSKGLCTPDGDMGDTTTNPYDADTDGGSVEDGVEDADQDGVIDDGETDPNDPTDDLDCQEDSDCDAMDGSFICEDNECVEGCRVDSDCGDAQSGRICVDDACVDGCRAQDGNGCPTDQICTSMGSEAGICEDYVDFGGGGCQCGVRGADSKSLWNGALLALAVLALRRRRKRRR